MSNYGVRNGSAKDEEQICKEKSVSELSVWVYYYYYYYFIFVSLPKFNVAKWPSFCFLRNWIPVLHTEDNL
jgi:hypothetical protein